MRGGHRARQLTPAALRGLLPVALGVKGVEQRGKGRKGVCTVSAPYCVMNNR